MADSDMRRPPLFSVIMPTWNRGVSIRHSVSSVLLQTLNDFELIVVDDHSEIPASKFLSELNDPRLRNIRLSANSGVATARNVGIKAAKGQYLAFLDDDDEFLPEKLEVVRTAFVDSVDVVYHCMRIHFVREGFSYINSPSRAPIMFQDLLLKNLLGSPSMVVLRKSACLAVGAFDETLPALEDYELWLRLSKGGHKFAFVERVLTDYFRHTGRTSRSLSLSNDISAWRMVHDRYREDYDHLTRDRWIEHLQKIDIYRAFRCLLAYRRRASAGYFLKSFARQPSLAVLSLLPVALLALLSPKACLLFQGHLKRLPALKALYLPKAAVATRTPEQNRCP